MTVMLLEWVITSSFLILTVLALRAVFGKRVSARLRYALWAVVLVRLLVPVQLFTSPLAGTRFFSESRTEQTVTQWPITSAAYATPGPDDVLSVDGQIGAATLRPDPPQASDTPVWPGLSHAPGAPVPSNVPEPPTVPIVAPAAPAAPDLTELPAFLGWVWLGGCAALALVLAASNLRFALRLRRSRIPLEGADCPLPVYTAAGLPSPCLFGLSRPTIYVTPEAAADPVMLRHVLAHEYTHFRQGDHLWSFLRCVALAVHWWNPLVWVSVKLSRRDGELSCDEGALKRLGDGERLAYGNTLLALVTAKPGPGDLLCFATTMAGEKKSLKERVSRIAHAPKRWLWAAVAVVLATALACACAFSAAEEPEQADEPDAELPEYTLTYSMNWDGAVLVEGLDGAYVQWYGPVPCPSLGRLDFDDAAFCCPGLADRNVFGHASWTDETRTAVQVSVTIYDDRAAVMGPVGCIVDMNHYGFFLHFSVELESGTVLERNFQSYIEGETLELTDREMVNMARILAKPLTEAEDYYQSHTDHSRDGELQRDGWALRNTEPLTVSPDLNRNGVPETVVVGDVYDAREAIGEGESAGRGVGVIEDGVLLWMGWGSYAHADETSFLLYLEDGEYYLMELRLNGQMGHAQGYYGIFTLENRIVTGKLSHWVDFDYCTDSRASVKDNFDPEAVAAFVDAADELLERCTLLVDTGRNYLEGPPGQLRVNLRSTFEGYAPGFRWDDGQTTLENAVRFKLMAEHPAFTMDLNSDWHGEMVDITEFDGGLRLELRHNYTGELIWSDEGYYAHAGWNAVFLCTLDGKDYLLRYNPYMGQGWCNYGYELFTLTQDGEEEVARKNGIQFDINFGSHMHEGFDPEAIAAFMDEINGLLAHSVQLINTDDNLWGTFQKEGRLYDSLWWLDSGSPVFVRDEEASLLENLREYQAKMEAAAGGPSAWERW